MGSRDPARVAVAPYTRAFLAVYDLWVIRWSNRFAWRCPAEVMLDQYDANLGQRHLEVGPGSGWYLRRSQRTPDSITLMDLNATPLAFARRRLERDGRVVQTEIGNLLDPVPVGAGREYDSIGINFVLHCVPGSFEEKGCAFAHLARALADHGVLFGSTILNGRPRSAFGRVLNIVYRRISAFNNAGDVRAGLESALRDAFGSYSIREVGSVTLFVARDPRR